jgi:glycosyltransferase involved in cell wall biosynthesis
MGVSVVMPAFNEAGKIGGLLAEMPKSIDGHEVTVVVVDDGSTDATPDIAGALGAVVIRHPTNQGKGAALCRAMEEIRALPPDALVWMDGDGQHLPSWLPDLVRPVLFKGIDLCVGSRYLGSGHTGAAPLNRLLVRAAAIRAVALIAGYQLTDPFSGFRCFSRDALHVVRLESRGYEAELESVFAVARAGLRLLEVPVPRIYGPDTSKMGYRHGALQGRLVVLTGYARAIHRARQRRDASTRVPIRG